jgi:hypothetical protein
MITRRNRSIRWLGVTIDALAFLCVVLFDSSLYQVDHNNSLYPSNLLLPLSIAVCPYSRINVDAAGLHRGAGILSMHSSFQIAFAAQLSWPVGAAVSLQWKKWVLMTSRISRQVSVFGGQQRLAFQNSPSVSILVVILR